MMSKHRWIQLMVGGLIVVSLTGCSSLPAQPATDASATPHLQAPTSTAIVSTVTQEPTRLPGVQPSPPAVTVQQWTAVPIAPAQTITKEKTMSSDTPFPAPLDPGSQSFVKQAKEDLARRLGVSVDSITVGAVIGQEFSVDAFNCRTSKERIARDESPAVISGQSILLSASGRRYEYHASGQTVIFCRPLP
jgi:hypothetical protein